jgi:GTP-binding protein HflX
MDNNTQPPAHHAARPRALVLVPQRTSRRALKGSSTTLARAFLAYRTPEARLDEAVGLAVAIDLDVRDASVVTVSDVRPATFIGSGKVIELGGLVKEHEAELVVVDTALTPVQQRNLEKAWACKVLDRTGLILEIFGRRARTREGTLQVELAHLSWQKSRLVRSWTHLERQRGGFGFLGGPGETQIEADRRVISERITKIERELAQVKRTRGLHRSARQRVPYPVIALVGYTNAGKSTLINRETQAGVLAEDMLFATLDPTLRAVRLPHGANAILSDTVGFISDLPTTLVAAFRATLEEVLEADVIVHVRDISHEDTEAQAADVHDILTQLGVDVAHSTRLIEVWNKMDIVAPEAREGMVQTLVRKGKGAPVMVSALTGEGMKNLYAAIEERLSTEHAVFDVEIAGHDGASLSWLYRHAEVLTRFEGEDGAVRATVRVQKEREDGIRQRFGLPSVIVQKPRIKHEVVENTDDTSWSP